MRTTPGSLTRLRDSYAAPAAASRATLAAAPSVFRRSHRQCAAGLACNQVEHFCMVSESAGIQ